MSAEVQLSRPVLELLTRWATCFEGPCEHRDQQQYGRPGDVGSGCLGCAGAFDGWDRKAPCDLCGALTHPPGAWSLPAADTGNVQLLLRVCDRCDLTTMEDTMTTCCADCVSTFARHAAAGPGVRPDFGSLHPECREGLVRELRGYGARSSGQPLRARVAVVRTLRALRSAS